MKIDLVDCVLAGIVIIGFSALGFVAIISIILLTMGCP